MQQTPESLLCVANFPANTGYAWNFIEGLYAGLANSATGATRNVYVAYPKIDSTPVPLIGSKAIPVCLDLSFGSWKSCLGAMRWVRAHHVRTVYFSDRLQWSLGFLWLRLGGVRRIVVHDHTSGERIETRGIRLWFKKLLARLPWINADQLIAVSDYVASRYAGTFPARKVQRLWNYVEDHSSLGPLTPGPSPPEGRGEKFDGPLLVCACRAEEYKGVHILLQAFDRAADRLTHIKPTLLYLGDGNYFAELKRLWETLKHRDQIQLLGYRQDAKQLVAAADICVAPSIWQEAFSLAVAEPMICGKAVIASRVGGIPELIEDGVRGLLVPPEDVEALARAIESLCVDPDQVKRLGQQAREYALVHFDRKRHLEQLERLVFGPESR